MNGNGGFAIMRFSRSEDGLYLLKQTFWGADDLALEVPSAGIHAISYVRDQRGLISERRYLDVQGRLVNHKITGIAWTSYVYDSQGNLTSSSDFDMNGELIK